jgi:hypothetical protein
MGQSDAIRILSHARLLRLGGTLPSPFGAAMRVSPSDSTSKVPQGRSNTSICDLLQAPPIVTSSQSRMDPSNPAEAHDPTAQDTTGFNWLLVSGQASVATFPCSQPVFTRSSSTPHSQKQLTERSPWAFNNVKFIISAEPTVAHISVLREASTRFFADMPKLLSIHRSNQ